MPIDKELLKRSLTALNERFERSDLQVSHVEEIADPETQIRRFRVFGAPESDSNKVFTAIYTDEDGELIDSQELEQSSIEFRKIENIGAIKSRLTPQQASQPTISPNTNDLDSEFQNRGDVFIETITLTIPPQLPPNLLDIYFLADITGSMSPVIRRVQSAARIILDTLREVGSDVRFGVGSYNDFILPTNSSSPFIPQQAITDNDTLTLNAIQNWTASGGGDAPEAQLFALDRIAANESGAIGWRPGSKRIVVWFGDAPGHEPVCQALTGLSYDILASGVARRLQQQSISVIAISTTTATTSLDSDPTLSVSQSYINACGPAVGFPGQARLIANETGGLALTEIEPDAIVEAIISSVEGVASRISSVRLVPTGETDFLIASIDPLQYNDLTSTSTHELPFRVRFERTERCDQEEEKTLFGRISAEVDGIVVAEKLVTVTLPKCTASPPPQLIQGSPAAAAARIDNTPGSSYRTYLISVFAVASDGTVVRWLNQQDPENPEMYEPFNLAKPPGTAIRNSPFATTSYQPTVNANANLCHLFVTGSNHRLFERIFNESQIGDWIDHGQLHWTSTVEGSPAAVSFKGYGTDGTDTINQDESLYTFTRGSDNRVNLHQDEWAENEWSTLGNAPGSLDIISDVGVSASQHVFAYVVAADGGLYAVGITGTNIRRWFKIGRPDPTPESDTDTSKSLIIFLRPSVTFFRFGGKPYHYAFVVAGDGHLWVHRWEGWLSSPSIQGWHDCGPPLGDNTLRVASSASSVASGKQLYSFVRGSDSRLYSCYWNNSSYQWTWREMETPADIQIRDTPSTIVIDVPGKDPIYVYVRTSSNNLYMCRMNWDLSSITWSLIA